MNHFYIERLLQRIENTDQKKVCQSELSCITKLVYFSGIRQKEIVRLRVLDVVDANNNVKAAIRNKNIVGKKKKIIFPDQARGAIRAYLAVMGHRNPALVMKRKPLFPTYRDERTLRRHWKDFNTNFSEIREGGMKSHFARNNRNAGPLMPIYKEGSKIFRISDRQYYAVVANKKIQDWKDVNDARCIDKFLELWEKIEKIDHNSPSAKNDAIKILEEANEVFRKIQKPENIESHESLIDHIRKIAKSI